MPTNQNFEDAITRARSQCSIVGIPDIETLIPAHELCQPQPVGIAYSMLFWLPADTIQANVVKIKAMPDPITRACLLPNIFEADPTEIYQVGEYFYMLDAGGYQREGSEPIKADSVNSVLFFINCFFYEPAEALKDWYVALGGDEKTTFQKINYCTTGLSYKVNFQVPNL